MFKLKLNKRVIALALSFVITLPLAISAVPVYADTPSGNNSNSSASGDSTKRLQQFMDFAQKKDLADISDVSQITYSDLRVIGIFISNFYKSWETSLDFKDDKNDETKEDIKEFLTQSCNFSDTVADKLIAVCWNISKETAQPLYYTASVNGNTGASTKQLTYSEFVQKMYSTGDPANFSWKDNGGTYHTVFRGYSYSNNSQFSASALSYGLFTSHNDSVKGTALTLKTDLNDAINVYNSTDEKGYTNGGENGKPGGLAYEWYLYVDAFGNILMDTDEGGIVLVPACQNPFTWKDKSGVAGNRVPLNNIMAVSNTSSKNTSSATTIYKYDDKFYFDTRGDGVLDAPSDGTKSLWSWTNATGEYGDNGITDFLNNDCMKDVNGCNTIAGLLNCEVNDTSSGFANMRTITFPAWQHWDTVNANETSNSLAIDDLVMYDTTQAFTGDTKVFSKSENGIFSKSTETGTGLVEGKTVYKSMFEDSQSYKWASEPEIVNGVYNFGATDSARGIMLRIYVTYLFGVFGTDGTSLDLSFSCNLDGLPPISMEGSPFDSKEVQDALNEANKDKQTDAIRTMVYYMLNPAKGIRYFKQWFKTKACAMLVGVHESIVGKGSDVNLGVTKYTGFEGYTVTPELSDVSWTSVLLDKYQSIFVIIVIVVGLILLGYVLIGSMTPQKAVTGLIIFAFSAYIVPSLIDFTINTSNKVSTSVYGDKFTYWALVQHQSYSKDIDTAAEGGDYEDYLETTMLSDAGISNSTAITLKWQCPKKNNYMYSVNKELKGSKVAQSSLLKYMIGNEFSNQTFLDKPNSEYLYRSYTDISNNSRYLYRNLNTLGGRTEVTDLSDLVGFKTTKYKTEINSSSDLGFEPFNSSEIKQYRWTSLYTSKVLRDAISQDYSKITQDDSVGINPTGEESLDYDIGSVNNSTKSGKQTDSARMSALAPFALYTESPFYYFSWNFYDQGMSCDNDATNGFKDLVLGSKTGGEGTYFYNNNTKADSGYGEIRDYLDMRSLFTGVIPILREANRKVLEWDNLYGLQLYDGIPCDEGVSTEGFNSEQLQQYWHNKCVAKVWNMYTPWLDIMYDCNYAKPQNISVNGQKFLVQDPLDYKTYWVDENGDGEWNSGDEGRPMIFSRSEMKYYGLSEADLTTVEQKILKVQDDVMEDLYKLNNYVTFNDEVLNTASAMIVTFDFNREFSQAGLLSEGHQLYPQAFELKNFSYDAYLRLILSSSSGESLLTEDHKTSLYQTILENTGVVTGILLVINDIVAVHCISCVKLFFLVGIFILSILMIICSALRLELKISTTIWQILICPLIKFLAISVGHALLVSFFMSDGATGVTGANATTISTGEPTTTVILMLILNIAVFYLYFRITRGIVGDVIKYMKVVGTSVQGVAGQLYTGVTGLGLGTAIGGSIGATGNALKTGAGLAGGAVGGVAKISGNVAESTAKHVRAGADIVNSTRDVAHYGKDTRKKENNSEVKGKRTNEFDELCRKGREKLRKQSRERSSTGTKETETNKKDKSTKRVLKKPSIKNRGREMHKLTAVKK